MGHINIWAKLPEWGTDKCAFFQLFPCCFIVKDRWTIPQFFLTNLARSSHYGVWVVSNDTIFSLSLSNVVSSCPLSSNSRSTLTAKGLELST